LAAVPTTEKVHERIGEKEKGKVRNGKDESRNSEEKKLTCT